MKKAIESNTNKISVKTLFCVNNLVDSEHSRGSLLANGFEFTDAYNAEAMVINTCWFTKSANEENVQVILETVKQY